MSKIDPKETTKQTPAAEPTLQDILDKMSKLEAENRELREEFSKGKEDFKKAKERYKGPIKIKYRLWGGVPVLSYTSCKKRDEYDYTYKLPSGEFIDNHYVVLDLLGGKKTAKQLRTTFDTEKVLSEPTEVGALLKDGDKVTSVTVEKQPSIMKDIEKRIVQHEGEEIFISPNCIN